MLIGPRSGSARPASHSASRHSCRDSNTTDAFLGGTSVRNAYGSAFSRNLPSRVRISNLYREPGGIPGRNSSQIPDPPSDRIGWSRPSQPLKSPTTPTEAAFGAQTANDTPV